MSQHPLRVVLVPESDGQALAVPGNAAIAPDALPLAYVPGQSMAQAVYLSGLFQPPALCSGLACCGRCRMRVIRPDAPRAVPADARRFSPEELEQGWRLACRHPAQAGMVIDLPPEIRPWQESYARQRPAVPRGSRSRARGRPARHYLAVDLGTTTLQWRQIAVNTPTGDASGPASALSCFIVWEGSVANPLTGAGSDVVSRLAAAATPSGKQRLHTLSLGSLASLADNARTLARSQGAEEIEALCLAANPAMTCLALGLDTKGLAVAPYTLPYAGGRWEDLPGLPPVWIPPQLSPFVGGDISAGYASLALNPQVPAPPYPFLLADLGTNGEFLLALAPDTACSASVALGPALEGAGLSQGTEARPGAVANFTFTPGGIAAHPLPGDAAAAFSSPTPGITGTGYIALLDILLRSGIVNREGRFSLEKHSPLRRFFTTRHDPDTGETCLDLPLGLRLMASDIEALLKAKAAFSLGLQRLLDKAGLGSHELARVYVAGALGMHVDKAALETLGFFPQGMGERIKAVGNSSLTGAALLMKNAAVRPALAQWAARVTSVDLAADALFVRNFAEHMRFSW